MDGVLCGITGLVDTTKSCVVLSTKIHRFLVRVFGVDVVGTIGTRTIRLLDGRSLVQGGKSNAIDLEYILSIFYGSLVNRWG